MSAPELQTLARLFTERLLNTAAEGGMVRGMLDVLRATAHLSGAEEFLHYKRLGLISDWGRIKCGFRGDPVLLLT